MPNSYRDYLEYLATEPSDADEFAQWCEQQDVVPFLQSDTDSEHTLIYVSVGHAFIHAVLVPESVELERDGADLSLWNFNACSSWGIWSCGEDVRIESPCYATGSQSIEDATQIVFDRSFSEVTGYERYFEINQKIVHVLNLHYIRERKAWCKLDSHGDLEDIISIIEFGGGQDDRQGVGISIKTTELNTYCAASRTKVLRMFDFSRFRSGDFSGWGDRSEPHSIDSDKGIRGSLTKDSAGSFSRGFQLMQSVEPSVALGTHNSGSAGEDEGIYESFWAHDWKNGKIAELSCDPAELASYFVQSELPFQTTPAFFRPEVLSKYKADREKYTLTDRTISCRGAWHLDTYDINDAGQVHTYLTYLSRLPHSEQLHWKQYSEKPKGPISERAYQTDFQGTWYEGYDALPSLKHRLREIAKAGAGWWVLGDEKLIDKVQYPATASRDEWAEEVLGLDQLLVEGFDQKWLKTKATELGEAPDARLRQLKLIECCLQRLDFEEEHAHEIMTPFHDLHNLRSLVKGHRTGSDAEAAAKSALTEFESYRNHFRDLCQRLDESLAIISEAFEEKE